MERETAGCIVAGGGGGGDGGAAVVVALGGVWRAGNDRFLGTLCLGAARMLAETWKLRVACVIIGLRAVVCGILAMKFCAQVWLAVLGTKM